MRETALASRRRSLERCKNYGVERIFIAVSVASAHDGKAVYKVDLLPSSEQASLVRTALAASVIQCRHLSPFSRMISQLRAARPPRKFRSAISSVFRIRMPESRFVPSQLGYRSYVEHDV